MENINSKTIDEIQIRALIDNRTKATCVKDIEGAVANYAEDVIAYDLIDPLQYTGSNEIKKRLKAWFSAFKDQLNINILDLKITTSNDTAFSHSFNHVNGIRIDGELLDMWWRETLCYRKIGGKWIITHSHNSVPFNVESGKASLTLKPSIEISDPVTPQSNNISLSDLIKKYFSAYELKNRKVMEELMSDEFTFTSPNDDHINKEVYFENCWPFSKENPSYKFEKIFENGNEVFVLYECETKDGRKFSNTEFFRFYNGKVKDVEVYFGNVLPA